MGYGMNWDRFFDRFDEWMLRIFVIGVMTLLFCFIIIVLKRWW
jgi:hypothetical protein